LAVMLPQAGVQTRELRLFFFEIEIGELEAGRDRLSFSDETGGFEAGAAGEILDHFDIDAEGIAGGDEVTVLYVAGFLEDGEGFGEFAAHVQQPAGGLEQCLEHHDAGEDGEAGEVVGQVFLRQGDVFDADDARVCDQFDFIEQVELQRTILQRRFY